MLDLVVQMVHRYWHRNRRLPLTPNYGSVTVMAELLGACALLGARVVLAENLAVIRGSHSRLLPRDPEPLGWPLMSDEWEDTVFHFSTRTKKERTKI